MGLANKLLGHYTHLGMLCTDGKGNSHEVINAKLVVG
jgi:hypothetical protein